MNGDVALAGFVLTAEEWQALDPATREQLAAAARQEEEELPPRRQEDAKVRQAEIRSSAWRTLASLAAWR